MKRLFSNINIRSSRHLPERAHTLLETAKPVFFTVILTLFGFSAPLFAQAPDEAREILDTFVVHPDFTVELAAMEPVVLDPVDLEFDAAGRPYVIEMPDYPFATDGGGRLVRLDDADGDGYYESRHVVAEGLPMADSLLAYGDGFLVAAPPELVWVRDTDGDGTADRREVILGGFAVGNPQHNFGGLTYGLDNWVYASNGGNNGRVFAPEHPEEKLNLRSSDFRVDVANKRAELIGHSTGGFELAIDDYGRVFGTHNLIPISHLVFTGGYAEGVFGPSDGALTPIANDTENGLVRIYPIGKQETRVNHPEQSGYFSGACGITYYGGGAFPADFNGNMFIMDVVLNLVHRRQLEPSGTTFVAERADAKSEFLTSTDRAFRPVNATVAPDGALWIVDMHRDVIEHPEWIPDEIEVNLDLDAGKQQGRLLRITPKSGLPSAAPDFSRENPAKAVAALAHPNQWWRTTAQRLLVEWEAASQAPALKEMLRNDESAFARLHALWTLSGLGALTDDDILAALDDADAGVRENAVRTAEPHLSESEVLRMAVRELLADASARVRMQTALTLGTTPLTDSDIEALAALAHDGPLDLGLRLALVSATQRDPAPLLAKAAGIEDGELVRMLAGQAARVGDPGSAMAALGSADDANISAALDGIAEELENARDKPAIAQSTRAQLTAWTDSADPALARAAWRAQRALEIPLSDSQRTRLAEAQRDAANPKLPVEVRLAQLRLLAFAPFEERSATLYALLDPKQPPELQAEAIRQCANEGSEAVGRALIERWATLGPAARRTASNVLLYRRHNQPMLLDALENETIALGEMNFHLERRRTLLWSRDESIASRAEKLFSDAGVVTRQAALEEMRPALEMEGDPMWGIQTFQERCAQCHRMGDDGVDLGPNLTEVFRKSAETLLHDIVDPNAAVDEAYMSYTVETEDGELYTGIVLSESAEFVELRDASGAELRFPRSEIADFRATGLSLMPEDLQLGLDPQAMADLLAYLQEPK